ncbi:uncharacterized protein A1O9_07404 [Exophiala aquamarina CBS 119918]|uniref:tRNA (guanine(10)-N(2))-methyltransferase n=1 Tax=Exophiala aquamarina CBS 119918 TaxID=1182545 RepID=A0A072PAU8_9EURO|nr:uncharacterized protein A1O9_07404 [Exophiala aquamarina CBS 119918]KEF57214.1 hypothetical protein A1O9_07404 [Exophiala aquamarina CBS 119918]
MEYLIRFAQVHESFRQPEIEALSRLAGTECEIISYSADSPFCVIRFPGLASRIKQLERIDATIRAFEARSVLSKSIYELWGQGQTYDELHENVRKQSGHLWDRFRQSSFKFSVDSYGSTRGVSKQRELINSFSFLGFQGKISMRNPEVEFAVMEEWLDALAASRPTAAMDSATADSFDSVAGTRLTRVFLGRKLGESSRHLKERHDLKKRPYISTTSMDAELALITASLALAAPGKLFLDPFVGTGGFMIAAAELGAMSFGSDIDGRSYKGKGTGIESGVGANFKKYSLHHLFGDCLTSDLTNTPFRNIAGSHQLNDRRWLDGIVCDPPYGVREGLKVLGTRKAIVLHALRDGESVDSTQESTTPVHLIGGVPGYTLPGYVAPKRPYSFTRMLDDILDFAARTLVDGGRIAFWMPSANENELGEEIPTVIPRHSLLELKHECIQRFNKWSRRLLVYERLHRPFALGNSDGRIIETGRTADELNPFRKRYFQPVVDKNAGSLA